MQTEFSMFGAIATATAELSVEARRIASDSRELKDSITCGELEKILGNARKSTHLLRKIKFKPSEYEVYVGEAWVRSTMASMSTIHGTIDERLTRVEKELFGPLP